MQLNAAAIRPCTTWLAAGVMLAATGAVSTARGEPFAGADLVAGRQIHVDKRCGSCHAEKSGGDEGRMYLRENRRVKSLFDLRRYVSLCNTELKLDLFPEDERDVAAWVNAEYYKLSQ